LNQDVAVIIPARNEEKTIAELLTCLNKSLVKPAEVLVIDDHSTDQTSEIAKSFGVKVITGKMLPCLTPRCGKHELTNFTFFRR
jgi:4,4'-diaponeurosporenoate glycosyltransferase